MSFPNFVYQTRAICRCAVRLALFVFLPVVMMAQDPAPQTESEPGVGVPAPLAIASPRLLPSDAVRVRNLLIGGLGVEAAYDDSGVPGTRPLGAYLFSITPRLDLEISRPHTALALDYFGGVTFNQRALDQSQNTQAASADLTHAFNRRLRMELRGDYLISNNPFSTAGNSQFLSAPATSNAATFVTTPAATRTTSRSLADLSYRLGPHSILGASGSFATEHFRDLALTPGATSQLIQNTSITGQGYYSQRISRSQNIGFRYQVQDLRFEAGRARTLDHAFLFYDEISLRPTMTLTLFAGPDYTLLRNNIGLLDTNFTKVIIPGAKDELSAAGGVAYTVIAQHVAFRLVGQRGVTAGNSSIGAATTSSGSAELTTSFASHWSGKLGAIYADDTLLGNTFSSLTGRVRTMQGSVGLSHNITKNLTAKAEYARIQQFSVPLQNSSIHGDHNRVSLSLVYEFTRSLAQ